MKLLVQMDEKFWKVEDCENVELKTECLHTLKMLKVKYRTFVTMMLACAVSYFYGRLFENRTTDPENLIYESYIPKGISFWTLFIWEHLPGYCLVVVEIAMDFFIFSLISLTALQFKLLAYEMTNIFELEDDSIINDSFRALLNNTFSVVLLMYLGIIVLILCVEIYLIMSMDSLEEIIRAVVYAALMFFEFFICYCFPAQAKWYENMGSRSPYAKATLLLQGKCQIEVIFTAGGFLELNLQTALSVSVVFIKF
nr:unnamed protein product [Callosobruchus chinensis]